ncbi:ribonuclease III [Candidatus Protochlamydia amoebophila]|nr:ribonuclease III [Candidatus Protochlamydia amoebophila]
MKPIEHVIRQAPAIEAKLGYTFKDPQLLVLAFVHRSFINENREVNQHNERLEFLGDSVLGMLISDYLYCKLPKTPEGQLSYLRSRLVEASSCVHYIQSLDLSGYLLLGKGERMNDGRGRESILADLFEAIIGAIYLDGGLQAAKDFLFKNFHQHIEIILATPLRNWKALLQDYCQKNYQQTPLYQVLHESGPDHSKVFQISVWIQDRELGRGKGTSKKEAQQAAAADALSRVELP